MSRRAGSVLVVGLGNPGPKYRYTPHNVGFLVAEQLSEKWQITRQQKKYQSLISQGVVRFGEEPIQICMLLPQTYMNESGKAVGITRGSLHVPLERIIVVHDEIDLPFGEVRTRFGGGLAGHNGLKSLKQHLASGDFWRIRVGVGRPESTDPELVANYVLGSFKQSPVEVQTLLAQAANAVEQLVTREFAF